MTTIILIIFGGGVLMVLLFALLTRRKLSKNRESLNDSELVKLFILKNNISEKITLEVINLISEAYSIDRSKLRPTDTFDGSISIIDSWQLDAGAEKLENILLEKYGLKLPSDAASLKIVDLIQLIENSVNEQNEKNLDSSTRTRQPRDRII